jgi:tRNA pseudouridine55 synthase
VVARVRRLLGTRKVGHSGTLDPMATGLLVLGVGKGTRLLTFVTGVDKTYEATIRFGVETDSLDADGQVVATHEMSGLTTEAVLAAAGSLTGTIQQVPPMVSALKVDGRRLHELAREGVEVERAARTVTVHRFELSPTEDPLRFTAVVECSSGTYVRSLAADLGHLLGGGAHLVGLRRTAVGPFRLEEADPLDTGSSPEVAVAPRLLPLAEGLRHLPALRVDPDTAGMVRHGRVLEADALGVAAPVPEGQGPWAVLDTAGELLAVYERRDATRLKPAVVLAADAG